MAITVTATQGGSTGASLVLRVIVLNGAKTRASQTGASTNNQFASTTTFTQSITTTAGSNVYGASSHDPGQAASGSNATVVDDIDDSTNLWRYVTFKSLNVTGAATARGFTLSPLAASGPFAMLEILAAGTLSEDASSPAVASGSGTATTAQTTASFTPPAGSLLVAIVASNGGASVTTMTVSGGGFTWTEKVKNNPTGGDYAGIWIADVPAASVTLPSLPMRSQRVTIARMLVNRERGVAPTGLPVPVQPPEIPRSDRASFAFSLLSEQTMRRRQNADLVTPAPVIATPPPFLWDAPRYPEKFIAQLPHREHGVAPTGWPVPIQPPERMQFVRRWTKPPWPRKGTVPPSGLPVPVQPPERMQSVRRWTRPLWPRRGNVPTNAYPFVASPVVGVFGSTTGSRIIPIRHHGETSQAFTAVSAVQPTNIPDGERGLFIRRRFLRSGVFAPTGWPVPVQPPERMQSVRRWTLPLLPRKSVIRGVTPPPVAFNPPISFYERRWSKPPYPRRGVVPPTGWPVPVQPPERMQSVRRLSRPLLPRKSTTENIPSLPLVTVIPFVPVTQRHQFRRIFRFVRTVQTPGILPGPIPSVTRPDRYSKIMRPRIAEPGSPFPLQVQPPNTPDAIRRKRRFIPPRRGNAQPNTGLPVPVQPLERMQFVRRWIRPLLPRRGVIPGTALPFIPPPVPVEVKLPVWVWITIGIPESQITSILPNAWIVVTIPLANEKEV